MLELLNQLDGFSSDDRIKVFINGENFVIIFSYHCVVFNSILHEKVQVIAATNRADILDPALMRSGRLDRKIEFPHPTEEARARILQIHSRKMNVHPDVNFEELARSTDDFNGAQLKAVCVEAGMLALRRDATEVLTTFHLLLFYYLVKIKIHSKLLDFMLQVNHEDFNEGIIQVQAKKKASLNYYAQEDIICVFFFLLCDL